MKRLTALAIAAGLLTASCSGHGSNSALPALGPGSPAGAQAQVRTSAGNLVTLGTGRTRSMALPAAPAGWAPTATRALVLANASDLGALSGTKVLTVRLGLQMHNGPQLSSIVGSGQTISPQQFNATYAPTAAEAQQVKSYLQTSGLSSVTVQPDNMLVSATGTAAQISKAFDTSLHSFSLGGTTVYANVSPAFVPQALGGIVVAVLGLNNAQAFHPPVHVAGLGTPQTNTNPYVAPTPTPCSVVTGTTGLPFPDPAKAPVCIRQYNPADYWRAYDIGGVPAASNVNVAIMTADGGAQHAISDLRVNEAAFGLPQVPAVIKQVGLSSPENATAEEEWTLDATASTGMAGSVKTLYLYATTSLSDSDLALEYATWVTDRLAPVGNSSFGGCELFPYLDGSMLVMDSYLLEGAAYGMTMFASSGDTGSQCIVAAGANGVPAGAPFVEYPAASPYIDAVGGTSLITQPNGNYQGEVGWNTGGGGVSQFEYSPAWETAVQPIGQTGESFRGVPDVSYDADPNVSGANLYTNGSWLIIGGTSLSSPLGAGAWARTLGYHQFRLGFAPPNYYKIFQTGKTGQTSGQVPPTERYATFNDILVGNNGLYSATPGYDYITGLGSPDLRMTSAAMGH